MAAGAISAFRQLGYAFGVAVLGAVFHAGLEHTVGPGLARPLSSGRARAVTAQGDGMARLAHHAFATGLDQTFVVAAGFGLIAGLAVLAFVRPARATRTPDES